MNQDDMMALVLIAGGLYAWKTGLLDQLLGMLDLGGIGGGGSGSGSGSGGLGITTAAGKMIYKTTGKVISSAGWYTNANQSGKLSSGGSRPTVRYGIYETRKSNPPCVPFQNSEATVYVTIGAKTSSHGSEKCTVGVGGPGQEGNNCCVYHIGFDQNGNAYGEEEGAHSPKPTIHPITSFNKVKPAMNIGPMQNRTLGLKTIFWISGGTTHVEGWVDKNANGNWIKSFEADNPTGGSGLPVITRIPMVGKSCQELRFRMDNHWPITLDRARSNIAEIAMPPQPAGGVSSSSNPTSTIASTPTATAKGKSKSKTTKSGFTRSVQMTQTPVIQYNTNRHRYLYM